MAKPLNRSRNSALPAAAAFESTCPRCQTDFDVGEAATQAACPGCGCIVRFTDSHSPSKQDPIQPLSTNNLAVKARVGLTISLVAPVLATTVAYAGFQAWTAGARTLLFGLAWFIVFLAVASAGVATWTGLRGWAWTAPVVGVGAGALLFAQNGLFGFAASVFLPQLGTAACLLLGVAFVISLARRALSQNWRTLQVLGLTVSLAMATVAGFVLWLRQTFE